MCQFCCCSIGVLILRSSTIYAFSVPIHDFLQVYMYPKSASSGIHIWNMSDLSKAQISWQIWKLTHDFLLALISNICHNSAPVRDKRFQNLRNLDVVLSRSLKTSVGTAHTSLPNSARLRDTWLQNLSYFEFLSYLNCLNDLFYDFLIALK